MAGNSELSVSPSAIDFDVLADIVPITVLHVDDESDFADLTSTYLERENPDFDVIVESSAADALERLADDSVALDCIVSDYQMPGMDGIEFLEAIRENHPDLPFILFTGQGSEEVAGRAISAGVTDYLQKERGTDQFAVLANRITNAVEKTRAERNAEQLLSAIETAREGISLIDRDGRFVYVNPSYAETYGYESTELLGEHWDVLYPDGHTEYVHDELIPSIPDEGVLREQTTMVTADGDELVTDHALSYTPSGLMVCNVDVIAPDFEHGLLADVFDALDDLAFFFDEDGTLEFWNERVEQVTGYGPEELSTITPRDLVYEGDRAAMNDYVWTTRETGQARVEVRLRLETGELVPYEFISKRVLNDRGDVLGRIGLGRDITERKQYERQIERQNERLEHFAEVLSHDLRNPLSIANGHLDLLSETGDETHYETAKDALDRMDAIVTDVLDLAQTGDLIEPGDYETVDLGGVAERAWAMIRRDDASLDIADTRPVEADASRLQQILENLFRNSIEHGEGDVSVRVGVLPDGDGLYVEDNGPGIPEDAREEVFEPGHSTKEDGTGFGLATVNQLVDAHEWEIRVRESDLGGVRFELRGIEFDAPDRTGE